VCGSVLSVAFESPSSQSTNRLQGRKLLSASYTQALWTAAGTVEDLCAVGVVKLPDLRYAKSANLIFAGNLRMAAPSATTTLRRIPDALSVRCQEAQKEDQ
jgi:hypothetical protein